MSRIERRYRSLETILVLRRLAERKSRSAALVAEQRVIEARRQRTAEREGLDAAVENWAQFTASDRFSPELALVWGRAVNGQLERLEAAGTALAEEEMTFARRQGEHRLASANSECAEALWRKARLRFDSWREERALAELVDAGTRRRIAATGAAR